MVVYVPLAGNPRGVTILAVLWPMTALSLVFLCLRLCSKFLRSRRLWWDDYLIVLSWIVLLASVSATTANVRLGFGLTQMQVPFENIVMFGIQSNISGFMSVLSVVWSKTSFAITLLRLADGWMGWFIWVLVIILNISQYISAITFWVSCNPPAKTWNPLLPGECWPTSVTVNYSMFVGAFSAFSDFTLALLPWRLLLRYNMYNREKIGAAIAMSMGVFAGIACIIKMTTIPLLYRGDFSYNSLPLVIWGFIEPALTIIAASIPLMRHLFKSFRRNDDGTLPSLPPSSGSHHGSSHRRDGNNNHNHNNSTSRSLRSHRAANGGRHLYQQHRDRLREAGQRGEEDAGEEAGVDGMAVRRSDEEKGPRANVANAEQRRGQRPAEESGEGGSGEGSDSIGSAGGGRCENEKVVLYGEVETGRVGHGQGMMQ